MSIPPAPKPQIDVDAYLKRNTCILDRIDAYFQRIPKIVHAFVVGLTLIFTTVIRGLLLQMEVNSALVIFLECLVAYDLFLYAGILNSVLALVNMFQCVLIAIFGDRQGHITVSRAIVALSSVIIIDDACTKVSRAYHNDPRFRPFVFYETFGRHSTSISGSLSNQVEAEFVTQVVADFLRLYPKTQWQDIAVITPYQQQRILIADLFARIGLSELDVSTVDCFQGREKEVIVFSCVRGGSSSLGFLADLRRMNVALTRSKSALWVVGNVDTLTAASQSEAWVALVEHAKTAGAVFDAREYPVTRQTHWEFAKFDGKKGDTQH